MEAKNQPGIVLKIEGASAQITVRRKAFRAGEWAARALAGTLAVGSAGGVIACGTPAGDGDRSDAGTAPVTAAPGTGASSGGAERESARRMKETVSKNLEEMERRNAAEAAGAAAAARSAPITDYSELPPDGDAALMGRIVASRSASEADIERLWHSGTTPLNTAYRSARTGTYPRLFRSGENLFVVNIDQSTGSKGVSVFRIEDDGSTSQSLLRIMYRGGKKLTNEQMGSAGSVAPPPNVLRTMSAIAQGAGSAGR